ncbi:MAG: NADPH-dependent oxidoreductase, partial [Planctomycetota bacterium]
MSDPQPCPTPDQSRPAIATMKAHRSVRTFDQRPLPDGLLEELVFAGTRASTSSNMQAYSVIAITEAGLKKQVAELCADQKQIHQSSAFLAICADAHKLAMCCDLHDAGSSALQHAEPLIIAIVDAALVMQNIAVAAESIGLGICMIGAMRNHPSDVARALQLPQHVFAVSGLCIGYPAEDGEIKPRLPLDAVLHHNRYAEDGPLSHQLQCYDEVHSQ